MTQQRKQGSCHVLIDGQNFYLSARNTFGVRYPNFDIKAVGDHISSRINGRTAGQISFYTGIPVPKYSPRWYDFWTNKLEAAAELGIKVFTRPLRYQVETDPSTAQGYRILATREKGIDLRIALDAMESAYRPEVTDIVIVSRDQDFHELVEKVAILGQLTGRKINLWSAYPSDIGSPAHVRGIDGMKPMVITPADYASCIDARDYRMSRDMGSRNDRSKHCENEFQP